MSWINDGVVFFYNGNGFVIVDLVVVVGVMMDFLVFMGNFV